MDRWWYDSETNTIRIGTGIPGGKLVTSQVPSYNSGFENRTDSKLEFTPSSRNFKISPTLDSYDIFLNGAVKNISAEINLEIPNVTGLYFVYFDIESQILSLTNTFSEDLIVKHCLVSVIYWNSVSHSHVYFADERHGALMDGDTHLHLHSSFGAQYISGLAIENIQSDASTPTENTAKFSIQNGVIRDEDIKIEIINNQPQVLIPYSNVPVIYRLGNVWYRNMSSVPNLIISNVLYYNHNTSGIWDISPVVNNRFF